MPGKQLIGTVAISPDGKLLAFPYQDEQDEARSTLIVIPSTGGPPIKEFPDLWGLVKWSPDGCCIVHYDALDDVVQLVEQPLAAASRAPSPTFRQAGLRISAGHWTGNGYTSPTETSGATRY